MLPEIEAWRLFCEEVEKRLIQKNTEGYTGWDGSYPTERLCKEMTNGALGTERGYGGKKECVDIAARAMMIHRRLEY